MSLLCSQIQNSIKKGHGVGFQQKALKRRASKEKQHSLDRRLVLPALSSQAETLSHLYGGTSQKKTDTGDKTTPQGQIIEINYLPT